MTQTIACDVSEFQVPVDDRYEHPWLIFRACDGTYRDQHFAANYAWARNAAASGKLAGYTVYCVYRPGAATFDTIAAMLGALDKHVTVLVDVESWGGQIHGDHSTDITNLVTNLAGLLGDKRRVLAYGNGGDLASIYPHRPDWLSLIVAAYSSVQPSFPNLIGWQYSDGQDKWPAPAGLPRSSAPFGRCDHNVFPGLSPQALAAALGVGAPKPVQEGFVMDKEAKDRFDQIEKDIADLRAHFDNLFSHGHDGDPDQLAAIVRQELHAVGLKPGGVKQ